MTGAMKSNGFNQTELGEVLDFFNGKAIKPGGDGEYPAYGSNGLIGRSPGYTHEDGIIIGRVGAYCGSIAYCADKFWASDNTIVAKPKQPTACIRYFSYLLRDLKLNKYAGGAAQPLVTHTVLKRVPALVAQPEIQARISALLSAYDDLIENNTRRIQLLERMAQALYREWFVHFRFPGHAQVKRVASPLGPIPQGWESGSFSDIAEIARSGINPSQYPDEKFWHYSIPAFDAGCMPLLEPGDSILSNKFLLETDCVLLSKLNPRIPRVWLPRLEPTHRAIASTEFLALLPRSGFTLPYVFCLCCSDEFRGAFVGRALGTSTSHQRVKPDDLFQLPVVLPTPGTVAMFTEQVEPMLALVHNLRRKIVTLRRTRDLLLPKLMSGALDVSKLDIATHD